MTDALPDVLAGWTKASFTAAGLTRDTYRRGTGPGVSSSTRFPASPRR